MMTDTTPIRSAVKVDGNTVFEGPFAEAHPIYERLVNTLFLHDVSVVFDVYPVPNYQERKTIYKAQVDIMTDAIYEATINNATPEVVSALYALLDKARENYMPYEYMDEFESREAFKKLEAEMAEMADNEQGRAEDLPF